MNTPQVVGEEMEETSQNRSLLRADLAMSRVIPRKPRDAQPLDWDKVLLRYGFGTYLLGSIVRYAWWHFHPYQQPPPPPVTRYAR